MNKAIFSILAMFCPLSIFADDVTPGIIINKTDGSNTSVSISQLQSIKFAEGNMVVYMKDNTQQMLAVDDITTIMFEDITTAIKTLVDKNNANTSITITDISGRIVYSGTATDDYLSKEKLSHGIYIITANGKSCKVMIK